MTTIPDSHRDLLSAPVAVLGTIGASGRPQLSGVWFLTEDDEIKFSLNTARQKVKNLQANPKASVLIFDQQSPYRYLEVRGDAEITPAPTTSSPTRWAPSTARTCGHATTLVTPGW